MTPRINKSRILREAMQALQSGLAAEVGQEGSYWEARTFLDKHGKYHDNVSGLSVLLDVAETALKFCEREVLHG